MTPNGKGLNHLCSNDNKESLLGITEKNNLHCFSKTVVSCENEKKQSHIWSLADTVDASITEDTESSDNRSGSQDCLFVRGLRAHGLSLHSKKTPTHREYYIDESSQSAKIFSTSSFNLQSFQHGCPNRVSEETYEYSSVEGINYTLLAYKKR